MSNIKYNRIKAVLAEKDKKNIDLASHLKVSPTTVSDWCTNKNQPSIQDLYRIAEFLKIDIRELLIPTKQFAVGSWLGSLLGAYRVD